MTVRGEYVDNPSKKLFSRWLGVCCVQLVNSKVLTLLPFFAWVVSFFYMTCGLFPKQSLFLSVSKRPLGRFVIFQSCLFYRDGCSRDILFQYSWRLLLPRVFPWWSAMGSDPMDFWNSDVGQLWVWSASGWKLASNSAFSLLPHFYVLAFRCTWLPKGSDPFLSCIPFGERLLWKWSRWLSWIPIAHHSE